MLKKTAVATVQPKVPPASAGNAALAIISPNLKLEEIRTHLLAFRDEVDIATGVAARAEIKDEESLGKAADVVKAIGLTLKESDEKRKGFTKPLRDAEDAINKLYKALVTLGTSAKTVLEGKIGKFQQEEQARRQAELDAQREEEERRAAELAEAHREIGDDAGAEDILDAAAALPTVAPPVRATGMYGGMVTSAARYATEIEDRRKFLYELATRREPIFEGIIADLDFGLRGLTALAKAIEGEEILPVNGFKFTVSNKPIVR